VARKGRREIHIGLCGGNLMEIVHLKGLTRDITEIDIEEAGW
jgi:hypothetical protein